MPCNRQRKRRVPSAVKVRSNERYWPFSRPIRPELTNVVVSASPPDGATLLTANGWNTSGLGVGGSPKLAAGTTNSGGWLPPRNVTMWISLLCWTHLTVSPTWILTLLG